MSTNPHPVGTPKGEHSAPGTKKAPPCTLVIFGASGDLTKRLLMPSLYNLVGSGLLPDETRILGVDHKDQTTEQWASGLTETMQSFTTDKTAEFYTPEIDKTSWGSITKRLEYLVGDFDKDETYGKVAEKVGQGNAIFYLAAAARFFAPVVEQLGKAGLLKQEGDSFRRVVIEKPFGTDLPSAQDLNRRILAQADESQIFRIDHFLGKETVQSIMAMRFGNSMFEPVWRREYIDHVQITAAETVGVELRGSFYEPTGALRDMMPNHLFQLLCMIAMEPPNSFAAEAVRTEKAKLVEAIRPVPLEDSVHGQYGAGEVLGKKVQAYRQEPNVAPDSRTETYIAAKLQIENWRWSGVPFYLRTGKRLGTRKTEISIHFKPAPYQIFEDTPVDQMTPNIVKLRMDPEQGIDVQYSVKVPGPVMKLGKVHSTFRFSDFFDEKPNVGYETLLYDCMIGDATLFQRADNIEASWTVVEPIIEGWGKSKDQPEIYPAGSSGPKAADDLLARDGRKWLPLTE